LSDIANTEKDHVPRVEVRAIIARKNELERIVPIYRQALEHIADSGRSGEWGKVADRALREAIWSPGQ
jgi:hypothetical protein